jgi:hypothetical protein
MYNDERADIDVEIEYERNIIEYMLKPTLTNNKTCFLLHPNLYSTCNYQSPHNLVLGTSIKTRLGNVGDVTLLILGTSIKARLGNLGRIVIDRLNYPSLGIPSKPHSPYTQIA